MKRPAIYRECRYCICTKGTGNDGSECSCEDHERCRDCIMPRRVMILDIYLGRE